MSKIKRIVIALERIAGSLEQLCGESPEIKNQKVPPKMEKEVPVDPLVPSRANKGWSGEEIVKLLSYTKQGLNQRKVAELLGRSQCSISRKLYDLRMSGIK